MTRNLHLPEIFMTRTEKRSLFIRVVLILAPLFISSSLYAQTLEERVMDLEARIVALEARLGDAEAEAAAALERADKMEEEKKSWVSMDNMNPFVRHAWVNEAWTREESWAAIREGLSPDEVVAILGEPTRTVRSLKPMVDLVYFYEGSIQGNKIRGRISFRDDATIHFKKPTF